MESSSTIASRYRVGKRDREAFVGCCAIPRSSRWRFRDLGGSETYDKRERERRRREEREGRKDDCHPRAGERMRKRGGGGGSGDVLAKVTAGNAVCVRRSKVVCRVAELASSFSSFASLALSLSLERGPACCLFCSHRRGAAAQTAGMHQMHRTDRCPSRSTGFHLFTSDPVARARVFLSRPLAFLFSTPFHLALPRASSSTVHSDSNGERVVLRYYFSCSPRILYPPVFSSHLRSHRRRR